MAFEDAVTAAINTAVETIEPEATETTEAAETETAVETPETPAEEAPEPVAEVSPSEDDELKTIEAELVEKTPGLKQGRINISRHQAVLTRQRRAAEAESKKFQEQLTALEPLKQFTQQEWQDRLAAIQLAETQPEVFVREVLLKDPRYAKQREVFLAKMASDPPPPQKQDTITEAPQPDVLLVDGRLTYSPEQAAKLTEWKVQEQAKSLQSKYDKAIEELRNELTPIKQDREHNERLGQSMRKMSVVLADARANWPEFQANESKIHALISAQGNERMSLEEGYRRVVLPELHAAKMRATADREKIRAEERASLIKEMQKPTTSGLRPGQLPEASGSDASKPRDTTDVIKESMRAAGLK